MRARGWPRRTAGSWSTSCTTSTRSRPASWRRSRGRGATWWRWPTPTSRSTPGAGADPEVVQRFAAVPGTRVFPLQTNYRSTPEVVAPRPGHPPGRQPLRQAPARRAGRPRATRPVIAHLASVQDEARFVVQRIADLITEGRAPGEIAVLYRAHHHSVDLQLRPGRGRGRVRAVLGRALRGERPRQGRAGLLPPAPQPARRARLAPRAAPVRPGRGVDRARAPGRAIGADPDPLAAAAALRAVGPASASGLARFAEAIGDIARDDAARRRSCCAVARADWYRDHLQRAYPNWRDREGDLARLAELATRGGVARPLPRRPAAGRAGGGRRGRLGPGAPGRAVERAPGQGARVAGGVRAPGRGRARSPRAGR